MAEDLGELQGADVAVNGGLPLNFVAGGAPPGLVPLQVAAHLPGGMPGNAPANGQPPVVGQLPAVVQLQPQNFDQAAGLALAPGQAPAQANQVHAQGQAQNQVQQAQLQAQAQAHGQVQNPVQQLQAQQQHQQLWGHHPPPLHLPLAQYVAPVGPVPPPPQNSAVVEVLPAHMAQPPAQGTFNVPDPFVLLDSSSNVCRLLRQCRVFGGPAVHMLDTRAPISMSALWWILAPTAVWDATIIARYPSLPMFSYWVAVPTLSQLVQRIDTHIPLTVIPTSMALARRIIEQAFISAQLQPMALRYGDLVAAEPHGQFRLGVGAQQTLYQTSATKMEEFFTSDLVSAVDTRLHADILAATPSYTATERSEHQANGPGSSAEYLFMSKMVRPFVSGAVVGPLPAMEIRAAVTSFLQAYRELPDDITSLAEIGDIYKMAVYAKMWSDGDSKMVLRHNFAGLVQHSAQLVGLRKALLTLFPASSQQWYDASERLALAADIGGSLGNFSLMLSLSQKLIPYLDTLNPGQQGLESLAHELKRATGLHTAYTAAQGRAAAGFAGASTDDSGTGGGFNPNFSHELASMSYAQERMQFEALINPVDVWQALLLKNGGSYRKRFMLQVALLKGPLAAHSDDPLAVAVLRAKPYFHDYLRAVLLGQVDGNERDGYALRHAASTLEAGSVTHFVDPVRKGFFVSKDVGADVLKHGVTEKQFLVLARSYMRQVTFNETFTDDQILANHPDLLDGPRHVLIRMLMALGEGSGRDAYSVAADLYDFFTKIRQALALGRDPTQAFAGIMRKFLMQQNAVHAEILTSGSDKPIAWGELLQDQHAPYYVDLHDLYHGAQRRHNESKFDSLLGDGGGQRQPSPPVQLQQQAPQGPGISPPNMSKHSAKYPHMGLKAGKVSLSNGILSFGGKTQLDAEKLVTWLQNNRTDGKNTAVLSWFCARSHDAQERSKFVQAGTAVHLLSEPMTHFFARSKTDVKCKQAEMLQECAVLAGAGVNGNKKQKVVNANFHLPSGYQI